MTVTINGTTGIAGVDGSAATPAVQGADTNTGRNPVMQLFYGDGGLSEPVGYSSNPLMTEFINEVMTVAELGMGRGEFGLNVLSKSITVSL